MLLLKPKTATSTNIYLIVSYRVYAFAHRRWDAESNQRLQQFSRWFQKRFATRNKSVAPNVTKSMSAVWLSSRLQYRKWNEWMNEWKCEDFKCVWKPTESRLCLTHYKVYPMHQSLSGQAPVYLASSGIDYRPHVRQSRGRCLLRSASDMRCIVPRKHSSFSDRGFGIAGPLMCNGLSSHRPGNRIFVTNSLNPYTETRHS